VHFPVPGMAFLNKKKLILYSMLSRKVLVVKSARWPPVKICIWGKIRKSPNYCYPHLDGPAVRVANISTIMTFTILYLLIKNITSQLASLTRTYMNHIDPAIANVLDSNKPEDVEHFCCVKIVTQGITGSPWSLHFVPDSRARSVSERKDILPLPLPFC
jgi:hypothetical protein